MPDLPRPPMQDDSKWATFNSRWTTILGRRVQTRQFTLDPFTCPSALWRMTAAFVDACDCEEGAKHSFRCVATPLYEEMAYTMAERPGYVDPFPRWHEGMFPSAASVYPHIWYVCRECPGLKLGEINAEAHFAVNHPDEWEKLFNAG